MPDKPKTSGNWMSQLIREAPRRSTRQAMTDSIRAAWTKTARPQKENNDG